MKTTIRWSFLGILTASLGACSQSTSCPLALVAPPHLYYPMLGAKVRVDVGEIIVGGPADGRFRLTTAGSPDVALGDPGIAPTPYPSSVPTGAPNVSVTYFRIALPALLAGRTYDVFYQAPQGGGPCGSGESSGLVGSFTT